MLVIALALALPQHAALDRNAAFIAQSDGLTIEFEVRSQLAEGIGKGRLELRRPNSQAYSLKWDTQSFRFVNSPKGSLSVRDDWRQYMETPAVPRLAPPPTDIAGLGEVGYPDIWITKSVRDYAVGATIQAHGTENVRGAVCDILTFEGQSEETQGTNTVWVDPTGRIARWKHAFPTANGDVDVTFDFIKVTPSASKDPATYANSLPIGFMPYAIPTAASHTRLVTDKAWFGSWLDARTNAKVDVEKLAKDAFVAMVFTAPDCPISARTESYLNDLRRRLKSKGCALIEVSLGTLKPETSRKDKDRTVFWDKDGQIEKAYGVPATPYFLVADKQGVLVRGWQGYTKETEAKITQTLMKAFDPEG